MNLSVTMRYVFAVLDVEIPVKPVSCKLYNKNTKSETSFSSTAYLFLSRESQDSKYVAKHANIRECNLIAIVSKNITQAWKGICAILLK